MNNEFNNFLLNAYRKHGNKYDYSKFEYKGHLNKGVIICPLHGPFLQSPKNHLRNKVACEKCRKFVDFNERKKDFFSKASQRYNNFFDYSEFNYIDAKTKSVIICPLHGKFEQSPDKHLQGINPCPFCEQELKQKRTTKRMQNEEYRKKIAEAKIKNKDIFLSKALEKFGDKFEYDLTDYKGLTEGKIKIKCPTHGWFEKIPRVFLISDFGCTDCGMEHKNASKTKSYESFVVEATEVHNGKIYLS